MKDYLIAEYCPGPFYMGWHLYIRESKEKQKPNADGRWGWIRHSQIVNDSNPAQAVLDELGIKIYGDGSCDYDGIAEIARRFPIPRERIGGKPRGCIEVEVDKYGNAKLKHRSER